MTLNEYCGNSEKASIGSVIVDVSELKHYWKVGEEAPAHMRDHSGLIVEISMFQGFSYFAPEDAGGILYTMDDHGNRKKPSVFRLKQNVKDLMNANDRK